MKSDNDLYVFLDNKKQVGGRKKRIPKKMGGGNDMYLCIGVDMANNSNGINFYQVEEAVCRAVTETKNDNAIYDMLTKRYYDKNENVAAVEQIQVKKTNDTFTIEFNGMIYTLKFDGEGEKALVDCRLVVGDDTFGLVPINGAERNWHELNWIEKKQVDLKTFMTQLQKADDNDKNEWTSKPLERLALLEKVYSKSVTA